MKLWIIRHGQTDWNKNGKIQGSTDVELNETGIKQAEDTIQTFNEYNFDLIICSTLKRAIKTAQIINKEKNIEIKYDSRLIERHCGDYEGTPTTLDEEPLFNINTNVSTHNIEPVNDLYKRVSSILDEVKEKYKDKRVLLVTHGGTTRAIEAYFFGVDEKGIMPPETIKNCEIREYEYKD